MTGYFRAVALDADGTIAQHDVLLPGILDALRRARTSGLATLLVTGRTLGGLRATFRGLESGVSMVVAENGAVLLACSATDELAVLAAVRRLGLDYQLVANRGALMVGEFHRSLQRTGHDGRVRPKQQPVEAQACQAQRCQWKSARRSG